MSSQSAATASMSAQKAAQIAYLNAIAKGPPYPPRGATLGGIPDDKIDVGVSAMFIAIFAILAAVHIGTFQRNKSRGHMFVPSGVTFGFCMSRIVTFSMRIAWAKHPHNASLAIAAGVFVSAGVILLYILNLLYAQRILRGYHPRFGNMKGVSIAFKVYYVSIVGILVMVITCTVLSFYTLNTQTLRRCRDVQRFATVYMTVFCFVSLPIVILSKYTPSTSKTKFGKRGTLTEKVGVVAIASGLLTLESAFRAGTAFLPVRPPTNPAWYHKRAAFYCFIPVIEVLVVILYAVVRVDQRFWIPGKDVENATKGDAEKSEQSEEASA